MIVQMRVEHPHKTSGDAGISMVMDGRMKVIHTVLTQHNIPIMMVMGMVMLQMEVMLIDVR